MTRPHVSVVMVGRYACRVSGPSPARTHSRTKLLRNNGDVLAVADDVALVDASAIVAGTAVDDVALAVVRDHVVGTAARVDDVAAGPGKDEVLARTRAEEIVAAAAVHRVDVRAGEDRVVPPLPVHDVLPIPGMDDVVARAGDDQVALLPADDAIRPVGAAAAGARIR